MEGKPDLWLWLGDNIYADSLDMHRCGKVVRYGADVCAYVDVLFVKQYATLDMRVHG